MRLFSRVRNVLSLLTLWLCAAVMVQGCNTFGSVDEFRGNDAFDGDIGGDTPPGDVPPGDVPPGDLPSDTPPDADMGFQGCGGLPICPDGDDRLLCDRGRPIALGDFHTCVTDFDTTVRCIGDNANGQLGRQADLMPSEVPADVVGLPPGFVVYGLAAGAQHTCALMIQGDGMLTATEVYCWGDNLRGQLGVDSMVGARCGQDTNCVSSECIHGVCTVPTCMDGEQNGLESDVDCGGPCSTKCRVGQACMTLTDCQSVSCAGFYCVGGDCSNDMLDTLAGETDIDCGGPQCAPCAEGLACNTGSDCKSQICNGGTCESTCTDGILNGNEEEVDCGGMCPACRSALFHDSAQRATAVEAAGGFFTHLDAADNYTCALVEDSMRQRIECWGAVPAELGMTAISETGGEIAMFELGASHLCYLFEDPTEMRVRCRGDNAFAQLGMPGVPVQILDSCAPIDLSVGPTHSCVLCADSTAHCWGDNRANQISDEATVTFTSGQAMGFDNVVWVEAAEDRTCLISNGELHCVGSMPEAPGPVGSTSCFQSVAAKGHICSVVQPSDADGLVYCYGSNSHGQSGRELGVNSVPEPTFIDF